MHFDKQPKYLKHPFGVLVLVVEKVAHLVQIEGKEIRNIKREACNYIGFVYIHSGQFSHVGQLKGD